MNSSKFSGPGVSFSRLNGLGEPGASRLNDMSRFAIQVKAPHVGTPAGTPTRELIANIPPTPENIKNSSTSLPQLQRHTLDTAFLRAAEVRENAYAEYSGFKVGVSLICESANSKRIALCKGCNVENASYPQGWCAEPAAISNMIAEHGPSKIIAVVVCADTEDGTPVTPCGGCRQKLMEFSSPDTKVYSINSERKLLLETTMGELLPHAFTANRFVK